MLKTIHDGTYSIAEITVKAQPTFELLTRLEREVDKLFDLMRDDPDRTEVITVAMHGSEGTPSYDLPVSVRVADLIKAKRDEIGRVMHAVSIIYQTLVAATDRLYAYDPVELKNPTPSASTDLSKLTKLSQIRTLGSDPFLRATPGI